MKKFPIGRFRGIPVYKVEKLDWLSSNNGEAEEIYVVNREVIYHDNLIALLDSYNQLTNFNEALFNKLKNKYSKSSQKEEVRMVRAEAAETRSQEEEEPTYETVETAGGTSAVDNFMSSWRDNIDNEIAMLKSCIAQMEDMTNAVGQN